MDTYVVGTYDYECLRGPTSWDRRTGCLHSSPGLARFLVLPSLAAKDQTCPKLLGPDQLGTARARKYGLARDRDLTIAMTRNGLL